MFRIHAHRHRFVATFLWINRCVQHLWLAAISVVLIAVLYACGYGVMMKPQHFSVELGSHTGHVRYPEYRSESRWVRIVFKPAFWLDKRIRPTYWNWDEYTPPTKSTRYVSR